MGKFNFLKRLTTIDVACVVKRFSETKTKSCIKTQYASRRKSGLVFASRHNNVTCPCAAAAAAAAVASAGYTQQRPIYGDVSAILAKSVLHAASPLLVLMVDADNLQQQPAV